MSTDHPQPTAAATAPIPAKKPVYVGPNPGTLSDTMENRAAWTDYRWPQGGHEWSEGWGSTDALWCMTLFPRLFRMLPADRIVEIAPGFGRITHYLLPHCTSYVGIDVTPKCVDRCRERFASMTHARFELTDGVTLTGVEDHSTNLVISYDSLVHVERSTIAAYLREIARVLKPGGAALLHHSNLGAYDQRLSRTDLERVPGGRRASMSAARFVEDAGKCGLRTVSQEIIPWHDAWIHTDAISLVRLDPAHTHLAPNLYVRDDWHAELAHARKIHAAYLSGIGTPQP